MREEIYDFAFLQRIKVIKGSPQLKHSSLTLNKKEIYLNCSEKHLSCQKK